MKSKWGFLLSAKFAAILVLFFMPFINVSCSGMINVPLTGMEMATGTIVEIKDPVSGRIKQHTVEAMPLAAVAFGVALLGLLGGLFSGRFARFVNGLAGASGVASLLMLKNRLEQELLSQGGGLIVLQYEIGYWGALILFGLAAMAGLYAAILSAPLGKETVSS